MTADLERDLQMASTARPSRSQAVSAVELVANGGPSGRERGARALVRTPRHAPVESPSAHVNEVAAPETPAEELAPLIAPTMTESAPAAAPAPVVEPVATTDGHGPYVGTTSGTHSGGNDRGNDDGERGRGRGVIIRGGGAGDDHCERHPRGGRPGVMVGGMGGIGGRIGGNIGAIGTVIGVLGGGGRRSPYPRF